MKTVFNNSGELCHIWAHKRQAEGRTPINRSAPGGSSAFFEGDLYFSYGRHYCVARHLPGGYVAINLKQSSRTTERHKSDIRYATNHLKRIYVFDPNAFPSKERTQREVEHLLAKAATAKANGNRLMWLGKAKTITDDYNTFCDLVGHPQDKIEPPEASPEALAEIKKAIQAELKKEHARRQERERANAIIRAGEIDAWRQGRINYLTFGAATMLRVEGDEVQTSRGARIPVEDAKRLWPIIVRVVGGTKDYEVGMSLGGYQLTKIRRDGSIVVGCHDIPFAEIEGVAKELGLLKVEETA